MNAKAQANQTPTNQIRNTNTKWEMLKRKKNDVTFIVKMMAIPCQMMKDPRVTIKPARNTHTRTRTRQHQKL